MTSPTIVLRAKLLAPPLPSGCVPRARLRERFEPARPVTLVVAPAGFGKTLAVTEWLASSTDPTGWLSLDDGDNDAARFFVHLVAALEDARPGCCGEFVRAAGDVSENDVPALMARVANRLHEIESPFHVVLDDYHVIHARAVHQAVGFLVEHMPPTMRLVVTSRREPPLPLPRWRMRGRLTEIDESALRFSSDEVAAFLAETMGLSLEPEQARLLEKKTEGWIGGLQLAALSLVERKDRDEFLTAFAGDDRYVMDYLTAEVLAGQSPRVRRFLLRTSILERMNESLCGAVSGLDDCGEILERLERDRVFVIALDGKRRWYRYHHLFAGLLRHQLASSSDESANACHLAASQWFEHTGDLTEAARHARLAGNPERLAVIVETHGMELAMRGRSKQLLGWVREIPGEVLARRPGRLNVAMWCEYFRTGQVPPSLRARIDAMMAAPDIEPGGEVLAESLAVFEAYEAARDPARYAEAIERARALTEHDSGAHGFVRLSGHAIRTACQHALGNVTAETGYDRAIDAALENHGVTMFFFMSLGRARLELLRAGPAAARRALEATLVVAADRGWDGLPLSAAVRYGLGDVLYELGELDAAEATLEHALLLAEHEPSTTRHSLCLALARVHHARGRPDACEAMLERIDAEPFIRPLLPILPDIEVERAWLDLARGRLDEVDGFLERHVAGDGGGLSGVHGVRDLADLLVGRHALVRGDSGRAIAVLTGTLQAAEAGGRLDTVIRCRIDLAVARFLEGERAQAFTQLDAAVDCALGLDASDGEPRGYRRVFLDGPAQLPALIAQRLADAVDGAARKGFLEELQARVRSPEGPVEEPLSPSERRVLEHLIAGLPNKEIGQALFISPNTVKTHIRRIYRKLGARNRADAIRQARLQGIRPA